MRDYQDSDREAEERLDRIISKHSEIKRNQSDGELSEIELYQLSEADGGSQEMSNSKEIIQSHKDEGSVIKVEANHKFDPFVNSVASYKSSQVMEHRPSLSEKPQTEITFGDLTSNSSDGTFYGENKLINKDLSSQASLSQSQGYKRKPLLAPSSLSGMNAVIKEEATEEESSLLYSQLT